MQRLYEGMFVLDAGKTGAGWEDGINHVKGLMDRSGATVVTMKKWDERKLAYEIRGQKRGAYLLAYFRAETDKITGLERDAQLSEFVLRCLILRHDALTDDQAKAVKTMPEIKEEEARKERERLKNEPPPPPGKPRDEGEHFEVPRELADEMR
jgi:small subunit ribosomal protein S6